ncbi:uncharacterized protein LOC105443271 [Strongylocentrotus purpuratus]|uniref:Amidase domain-containing protein n=1 Tax=Strongylocentrotus purpuratus TaxID=7668 RepID=A0A7M7MZI1_STRPU|nr:uncharacterized protein LOC105443271 [Strongylocentrotus purpuratus]
MMRDVGARLKHNTKNLHPINKAHLIEGTFLKKNYCHLYGKAQNLKRQLEKEFNDVLVDCDVVVMPTVPFTAPPMLERNASIKETIAFALNMDTNLTSGNLTGHPSITINARSLGGLPVGLLLTSKKFNELRLLQIAQAFENFINDSTQ